jgi:hypothetical protein
MHALAAWRAARPEAASVDTPLCQDGQFSTCDNYLMPEKATRDVRHAKLHCLERPRRMVALCGRKLEDPSRHF